MEHLPPWLRNLPLPPKPASLAGAPGDEDDVPDWLRELQSEVAGGEPPPPAAPPAPPEAFGSTSWLSSLGAEPPAAPPAQADEQQPSTNSRVKMPVGATDWLRSMGRDPDGASEPISEPLAPADESGVPDWLRELSAEEVARGLEADQPAAETPPEPPAPAWLDDAPADASTVSASWPGQPDAPPEAGVPDWLRDVIDADAGEPPPARGPLEPAPEWDRPAGQEADLAAGMEVPAWLRDLDGDSAEGHDEPSRHGAGEEPDWLRGQAEEPAPQWSEPQAEDTAPDWLRDDEPAPSPAPVSSDEIPDWLRDVEAPSSPAPSAPSGDVYEAPAWLRGDEPAPPAAAPSAGEDIPAWLRDDEPAPPPVAPPAPQAEEVPSWLREIESPPPAAPGADDDLPAWLRESEGPSPAAPGADDDLPAWLNEAETPPAAPTDLGAGIYDTPAWLRGDEPAPPGPEAEAPTWLREALADRPDTPPPPDHEVPPWMSGEPPPPPPREPVPPPPAGDLPAWLVADEADLTSAPPSAADPGLPSWLRGVSDEPPPPPPSARPEPPPPPIRPAPVAEEGDSSSFLKGAELPSWLRVPEPELPAETAEGQQLDWLRRLGGPEQDDEAEIALPMAAAALPLRPAYERSPEQFEAINLLRSLTLAPYPEPATPAAPAPRTGLERIGLERILYALLAIALILGLILPQLTAPLQTAAPTAPGARELGAALDALGPEDVVLVAYEWGAQRSGELRPLEQAVIDRLIANKVKLILVSTDLQGTLLSFDLREPLRAAGYNVEPDGREFGGRDYVLLGYRPGGELALRSLAQDLRGELRSDFTGQDASQGLVANNPDGSPRINGIQDLAMILVLADQPQDVQVWMEQVRPATRTADGWVPMAFVIPQEAQPVAQPYLRLADVYHIAGEQGALALRAEAGADAAALALATGQLWYSVLVFLVLLLLGAIVGAVSRARGARSRGGAA